MCEDPPWPKCRRSPRLRVDLSQFGPLAQIAEHGRYNGEGHQEAEAPVLADAHDGAKALGGLRAAEIHEKIEEDLLEQERASRYCYPGAEGRAPTRDRNCLLGAAQHACTVWPRSSRLTNPGVGSGRPLCRDSSEGRLSWALSSDRQAITSDYTCCPNDVLASGPILTSCWQEPADPVHLLADATGGAACDDWVNASTA